MKTVETIELEENFISIYSIIEWARNKNFTCGMVTIKAGGKEKTFETSIDYGTCEYCRNFVVVTLTDNESGKTVCLDNHLGPSCFSI